MARVPRETGDAGPGILETALVLGGAGLLALLVLKLFEDQLGWVIGRLVSFASGG